MEVNKMNKEQFRKLFVDAMKQDTITCFGQEGNGEIVATAHKAKPCICIRDFETATLDNPDIDFTDFDKAWNYMQSVTYYRIMDVSGTILADNYPEEGVDNDATRVQCGV
jgi:hypothetical protein